MKDGMYTEEDMDNATREEWSKMYDHNYQFISYNKNGTSITKSGRICVECIIWKPWNEYHKSNTRLSGYQACCKPCQAERRVKYFYKNKNFSKQSQIYKQNGLCYLCEGLLPEKLKSIHVDHCHKTGKIRGIACNKCNEILKWVNDDVNKLHRIANNLEKYQ